MLRFMRRITGLTFLILIAGMVGWANDGETVRQPEEKNITADTSQDDLYLGKPIRYWVQCIRDRDPDQMEAAFDAIHYFGPDAWLAIPELTRIVEAPFSPIRIGADRNGLILSKLNDIDLRAEAVDALGAIGETASSSAPSLVQWALMTRVVPEDLSRQANRDLFIDLVAIDVLHRMRVAGAIAQFGRDAYPVAAALLTSPKGEERKLGVAILSEHILPIAAELLKSPVCEDQTLGLAILSDMWPVLSKEHLLQLRKEVTCEVDTN